MTKQTLESVCRINPESLGPGTRADFAFDYLDISSVIDGRISWDSVRRLAYKDAPSRARRMLRLGDVLLCTVRPGLKSHTRIVHENGAPLVGSTGFAVLRPNNATDSSFLFHQLFSDDVAAQLRTMETGSNYPAVNERDVACLTFFTPDVTERSRIGTVLDAVDAAIDKTAAVIAKLKQVRAGLLHDLLTRGLDDNGELRDPLAHPEKFKESPLGMIPKGWECRFLLDPACAKWFSGGTPDRSQSGWWTGSVPFLTPKDMKAFKVSDTIEHITELAAQCGSRLMPSETVFIVVRGMILAHTFPVCLSTRPFAFNQDIKAVRGSSSLSTRFLAYWFTGNANVFLRKATHAMHGTKKLDMSEINKVMVACPSLDEQDRIVERIELADNLISESESELDMLRQLKTGLMTDLLTGRVPVPETIQTGVAP